MEKTYKAEGEAKPESQIGATLEALAETIASRRNSTKKSYTDELLRGQEDKLLKKIVEEAGEVILAAKQVSMMTDSSGEKLEKIKDSHTRKNNKTFSEDGCQRDIEGLDYEGAIDHLRYEVADVVYHLLVVLERYHIGLEELAAELNTRMTASERPAGAILLYEEHIKRGV